MKFLGCVALLSVVLSSCVGDLTGGEADGPEADGPVASTDGGPDARSAPDGALSDSDARPAPDAGAPVVFPGPSWTVETPESQGVNADGLAAALSYFDSVAGSQGVDQALVVRNGYLIWDGGDIDNQHNVWSCTKSFTSTVLGLLIDDGACTLDTAAADHVASLNGDYDAVLLRHLASMTSGYDAVGGAQTSTPFDPATPLFSPGAEFVYWDAAMNQFGNVLTRIADEPIEDLFRRRIATPIDMDSDQWSWADWGTVDGYTVNGGAGNKSKGIHISARELARFGWLFLNRGAWDGEQLVSETWVEAATSVQVPTSIPPHDPGDETGTYGFNWWVNGVLDGGDRVWPHGPAGSYGAFGHNGNYALVIPEWQLVFVRLGTDGTGLESSEWSEFLRLLGLALE